MKFILLSVLALTGACATESGIGEDASAPNDGFSDTTNHTDASIKDALVDQTMADTAVDTGLDVEVPDDATNDATDEEAVDAPSDAPSDALKNLCLGVFCIKGFACCNVKTNTNYGLCENTSCVTTCCEGDE